MSHNLVKETHCCIKGTLQRLSVNEEKWMICTSTSTIGMEQVLEQGPWMIRNTPLILNKWIYFPFKERRGVLRVRSCVESRGRISFSHVLVEICSDSELKREVTMVVPNEDASDRLLKFTRKDYKGNKAVFRLISQPSFYRPKPGTGNAHVKATSAKSMDHGKASTSSIKSIAHNTMANSFEVLTSLAGDDGVARMPSSSTGNQGVESDENEVYVSLLGFENLAFTPCIISIA
ncbi:hypothetical protein Tco_0606879 [Tanacetum coccineum]